MSKDTLTLVNLIATLKGLEWSCQTKEDYGHGDMVTVQQCPSCKRVYESTSGAPTNGVHKDSCELKLAINKLSAYYAEVIA